MDFRTLHLQRATANVEAIVHLGGNAGGGDWEEILHINIIGTYNVLEAAHQNGIKCIAYASQAGILGPISTERTA